MQWLLNVSWPGGPKQGCSCRSLSLLHFHTGAAGTWLLPAVIRQSPEMCLWGRHSQGWCGISCQQPAAGLAVSSPHLCFKVSQTLVGSSQKPWSSTCCTPCCLWVALDGGGRPTSPAKTGLLPLLLVLAVRALMAAAKPTPHPCSCWVSESDSSRWVPGSLLSPPGHTRGECTLLQQFSRSTAGWMPCCSAVTLPIVCHEPALQCPTTWARLCQHQHCRAALGCWAVPGAQNNARPPAAAGEKSFISTAPLSLHSTSDFNHRRV